MISLSLFSRRFALGKYKFADLIVSMKPHHNPLLDQSQKYNFEHLKDAVDITIPDDQTIIDSYHSKHPELSLGESEYMMYGTYFYHSLIDFHGMMMHGSAISHQNIGYMFCAASGVGKSTHVGYWKQLFDETIIINDDKPAIRQINNNFYIYGTPFSGKTPLNSNTSVQLRHICFIEQSTENWIKKLPTNEHTKYLLQHTILPFSVDKLEKVIELIESISITVNIYVMGCTNDKSAALTAYDFMRTFQ
jgi:hypothetical protein